MLLLLPRRLLPFSYTSRIRSRSQTLALTNHQLPSDSSSSPKRSVSFSSSSSSMSSPPSTSSASASASGSGSAIFASFRSSPPSSVDVLLYRPGRLLLVNKPHDVRIQSEEEKEVTLESLAVEALAKCKREEAEKQREQRGTAIAPSSTSAAASETASPSLVTHTAAPPAEPPRPVPVPVPPQLQVRLCHQLDFATSGVMCYALSQQAAAEVSGLFAQRRAKKHYLALVRGHFPLRSAASFPALIDAPLSAHPSHDFLELLSSPSHPGRSAVTLLSPLLLASYQSEPVSLVLLSPQTGRRHQLRLHCSVVGRGIVGDVAYAAHRDGKGEEEQGNGEESEAAKQREQTAERMMLHAYQLGLPLARDPICINAPNPFLEYLTNAQPYPLPAKSKRGSIGATATEPSSASSISSSFVGSASVSPSSPAAISSLLSQAISVHGSFVPPHLLSPTTGLLLYEVNEVSGEVYVLLKRMSRWLQEVVEKKVKPEGKRRKTDKEEGEEATRVTLHIRQLKGHWYGLPWSERDHTHADSADTAASLAFHLLPCPSYALPLASAPAEASATTVTQDENARLFHMHTLARVLRRGAPTAGLACLYTRSEENSARRPPAATPAACYLVPLYQSARLVSRPASASPTAATSASTSSSCAFASASCSSTSASSSSSDLLWLPLSSLLSATPAALASVSGCSSVNLRDNRTLILDPTLSAWVGNSEAREVMKSAMERFRALKDKGGGQRGLMELLESVPYAYSTEMQNLVEKEVME